MNVKQFQRVLALVLPLALGDLLSGAVAAESNQTDAGRGAVAASFSTFQIVPDRNIFNPNRYARSGPRTYTPRTATRRSTTFSLAGIMSYHQGEMPGTYAFFDGTSAEFRKVAQLSDEIAGFKVTDITFDTVTIANGTNQMQLKVGSQLRLESAGHWVVAEARSLRSSVDESGGYRDRRRSFSSGAISESNTNNATEGMDNTQPPDEGAPGDEPPAEAAEGEQPAPTLNLPAGAAGDALQRLMEMRQREEQQSGNPR